MWPRVHGLRALELGTPGPMRARLNALALAGEKTATAGALAAYERDEEAVEHVGERLALIDDDGARVGIVEVVDVELLPFCEVGLRSARAEGEGFETVEQWRAAHARFFAAVGIPVTGRAVEQVGPQRTSSRGLPQPSSKQTAGWPCGPLWKCTGAAGARRRLSARRSAMRLRRVIRYSLGCRSRGGP